ncbi:hypothetical protein IX307_002029 [Bacteroides pyogenes]|uniref:Calcium-binding protein P n=2 Tax=Bacteroides pyogenes TaxID=310300 RepID=A0A5D3FKX0_9BACE|nr:DUF6452 family protein [Bacteroides pyogenes]MBR8706667.1 hypothetical protein [Bacteroides pyogenes]MBR8720855.1 hypothetical protein [Bacteroides pyogenes]MBR8787697.1 hypothetical protein [Bacteroides pyogenes]MBR8793197.1 hypothetical protein [Bacteroides pyogenes]MCF2709215.1 calcium-binding protein P [Bacteroides pyogenes]
MKNLTYLLLCLLIFPGIMIINGSCSDENDCSLTGRPMMYCALYTIDPETQKVLKDTLEQLTVTALGTDEVIINQEKNVHKLQLPLRYTGNTTVFVFHYDPAQPSLYTDTLYITQQNTPYFQSMECGYMMKQSILTAQITNGKQADQPEKMESVEIKNKEANTNEIQNLQIFYKYRDRAETN